MKVNKDRLALSKSFSTAKTIEQLKIESARKSRDEFWEEQRKKDALRCVLNALLYRKRPWYKRIFD